MARIIKLHDENHWELQRLLHHLLPVLRQRGGSLAAPLRGE